MQQLSLDREETERWMPVRASCKLKSAYLSRDCTASFTNDILATFVTQLLDSICMMAQACVTHIQTLSEEDITNMLQEPVIMALASIVFDPSAFKVLQGRRWNINESNSFLSSNKAESLQLF